MRGCSYWGDGGADRSGEAVVCAQGRRSLVHERIADQALYCLVIVDLGMTGDRDAHRDLGGIAPDRVIGGDLWLALYRQGQVFVRVDLSLHALLCHWCKGG